MSQEITFYDIEVYTYNSFVVFKNIEGVTIGFFSNKDRFAGMAEFMKGRFLCGYNNHFYDDHVLADMIAGKPQLLIKRKNDDIIVNKAKQYPQKGFRSIDAFQQIDVGSPGLKKIEGNMGRMILESPIPFDIDRELTDEELEKAIWYCEYDVCQTIEVYKLRIDSYFKPKQALVDMNDGFGERWNTTTLAANILLGKDKLVPWSAIRLNPDDHKDLSMLELVPEEVRDLWLNSVEDKGKITIHDFDCEIEFGFGGLHGVHKTKKRVDNLVLLDVASMYPTSIEILNVLGKATSKYSKIKTDRLAVKHTDKVQSDALKLILNMVYGLLKNQYSSLYNPKAALSVCVYGQIALYVLCKRLSTVGTIVNINTDGVGFIPHGNFEHIWHEWEKEFNMTLEEDSFDTFIQKDVNNYIGVKDGKVKVKGGMVSRYSSEALFKNNSARILDIALVGKLLYNKSVIDTLTENLDHPELYQYILQAGHTYQGTFDEAGNQYNKINRIFPTKTGELQLYKKRKDDGLVSFPDMPERMFIWNDDVLKLEGFHKIVDLNHYAQVVEKRLEQWV